MGWWVQDKQGHSFVPSGQLVWGDEVADVIDEALVQILEIFSDQMGRRPTTQELHAGLSFSLRGAGFGDESDNVIPGTPYLPGSAR